MDEELKPCPFCNDRATLFTKNKEFAYIIECDNEWCLASMQGKTIGSIIANWNNRPCEDALQARIAELEERIEYANDLLIKRDEIEDTLLKRSERAESDYKLLERSVDEMGVSLDKTMKRAEEAEDFAKTLNKELNRVGNASYAKDVRISQLEEVNNKLKSKLFEITYIAMGNGNALSVALRARAERAEAELNRLTNLTYVRCVEAERERAEQMVERLIEASHMLGSSEEVLRITQTDIDTWDALVAEWQARNAN